MPTLEEIIQSSPHSEPEVEEELPEQAQVEPLDGPAFAENVIVDRFPASIYDQTPDSYLAKFIEALCGDAGAGILKKETWTARLRNEAEYLVFGDLDRFYGNHFKFKRLASEYYTADPGTEVVTAEQLDEIERKDARYRRRVAHFLRAAQLGNSPEGLEEAAYAGAGIDVELVEHYKYIFDRYSDDILGLDPQGYTASVSEYVLLPRLKDDEGNLDTTVAYYSNIVRNPAFTPPVYASTASKPPTFSALLLQSSSWLTGTNIGENMNPDVERNMLDVLDRLRPVGALMSTRMMQYRFKDVAVDLVPFSTSERFSVQRYVRGRDDVLWPAPNPSQGFWIESNFEKLAPTLPGAARELPVVFHTIDDVHAYRHEALNDEDYGTDTWYSGDPNGYIPFLKYRSEKTGRFIPAFVKIFPFLRGIDPEQQFTAVHAIARPNTLLKIEGRTHF